VVRRERHTVNGRFYGVYYTLEDGRELYLAHRRQDQIYRDKNAWCIDVQLLDRCKRRGIKVIGVVARLGGQKMVWLTLLDDFFDSPQSFKVFATSSQRGLPLSQFRIDPLKRAETIAKSVKIR